MCKALAELLEGYEYAKDTDQDVWAYAVDFEEFSAAGLSSNDLRWLIYEGHVAHALETTRPTDNERVFRPAHNLRFTEDSCFVFTEVGARFAKRLLAECNGRLNGSNHADSFLSDAEGRYAAKAGLPVPRWDSARRELRVGEKVVKRFRLRSANQEIVLSAFEEEQWPAMIHDPLPPQENQDPKRRLQDTLKGLNRNQVNGLIRFKGDGTGEGVLWEWSKAGNGKAAD
jgi:hypothetical protein